MYNSPFHTFSTFVPNLPVNFLFSVGCEGKELYPLQDRREHQEEGAGVRQGVHAQRCFAAAYRHQQEEWGTI